MLHGIGQQERQFTIFYTSSLNGNLDGCVCKGAPKAGLVKRAFYLRRERDVDNSLLVDAGDIFDVYEDKLLAREILEVYRELDYEAVAVGDQEFSNGIAELLALLVPLANGEEYPLFCHNLTLCPDQSRCIFFSNEPLIIEKSGLHIGLFALLDPEVFTLYPEEVKKQIKLASPQAAAENMLRKLGGVDLTILLFHGSYEKAAELAENVEGIEVIVVGHEQRLIEAHKVNDSILVSPGEEGNRLGILTLILTQRGVTKYNNHFRLFRYEDDEDDEAVRRRIERYKLELREKLQSGGS
jgi:2',3'-cyclic-nucleotide 2'-phosphodiesterase/3'-nucleotidase